MAAGSRGRRALDDAANTRANTSGRAGDGGRLLIFISKNIYVQVGVRFQDLLEKGIHFAGDDVASKQWWSKQRVVVCVGCSGK